MPAIILAIAVVWGAALGIVVVVAISMEPDVEVSWLAKVPGTLSEDGGATDAIEGGGSRGGLA